MLDYTAAAGEVAAAIGIDFAIAAPAADEILLVGATGTIFNTAVEVGSANDPWNDTTNSTAFTTSGGGIKMVRVPVAAGPVFDATLGITNGNGYRLARIAVEADSCFDAGGTRACTSNLGVLMSVNNLLITQVSDPGPSAAVNVDFGYVAGASEAAGSGSTEGTTSATDDATIVVKLKGDFNSDGNFNGADLPLFGAAFSGAGGNTVPRETVWTGDFNGDDLFNGADLPYFGAYFSAVGGFCTVCP